MANDKDGSAISSKCSVCGENFVNVQECLKHELIVHSFSNKSPKNPVNKRLSAAVKYLNADEKIQQRERLKKQLQKCKTGEELQKIFDVFCMKHDDLDLIFTRIQTCLEKELRPAGIARIYPFGSIANGLALRDCDIDIYLDVSDINTTPTHVKYNKKAKEDSHQLKAYNRISKLLYRSKHFCDVYAIRHARVPIIKCKHADTGFSIDINVSHPCSRENTQFVHDLVGIDKRIQELMLFLKSWAKNALIIGGNNMTSYCLITMAIFFLQHFPHVENKTEENSNNKRILKSIKELQENCPFRMVQGVNYAYDLTTEENKPKIQSNITSWDLIKGFFDFYGNFNFEEHVIAPYYGKLIAKTDLTPQICNEYYKQLKTITQHFQGEPAKELQTERCMCVQDAFCLNQNTAKSITDYNKKYISLCLQNAKKICENPQNLTLGELYEKLLFETININLSNEDTVNKKPETRQDSKVYGITNLENFKLPQVDVATSNDNGKSLSYVIMPTRGDLRFLAAHYSEVVKGSDLLQYWCQHYKDAITTFLSKIYLMDLHRQAPTQEKQQKLDKDETVKDLNCTWAISCTVDLWSNRYFQKNLNTTFMDYQLKQTQLLHSLRRQNPKFSVTLNGVFKLNILSNNMGIEMKIELPQDNQAASISKKSPLRKFFNILKNTVQGCTLKDILNIDDSKNKNNETTKIDETVKTTVSSEVS